MTNVKYALAFISLGSVLWTSVAGPAFEGRIDATIFRGEEKLPLRYTICSNRIRIEVSVANRPFPMNLIDLDAGTLTLVFPHNRSFVRLKTGTQIGPEIPRSPLPAVPQPPGVPITAGAVPAMPMPAGPDRPAPRMMPSLPPMPSLPVEVGSTSLSTTASGLPLLSQPMEMSPEKLQVQATGERTNLLGYTCERFELRRRSEVLEVWATADLPPFQPYLRSQPRPSTASTPQEQWPQLLRERSVFPLLVKQRFEPGAERCLFQVQDIQPAKITDPDGNLFQPPANYHELEPLRF